MRSNITYTKEIVLHSGRGCKCLEIDCWDGDSKTNTPVVYHGYTVTTKIPFQEVISCVKGYVDANPDTFPIILSLENHCTDPFQKMMAEMLQSILRESLYIPEKCDSLPSPMNLLGKVVIKGKRPPEKDEEDTLFTTESSDLEIDGHEVVAALPSVELSRLTMFNGLKHKDFSTSMELTSTDMHSFSETKISKLLKDPRNAQLLRKYNIDHISRTYPAGSRVDSSNYNPVLAWSLGCQLVALNFQNDDSAMVVNNGRFRENGGCGYVRKPPTTLFTENESSNEGLVLKIKVLAGTCLPKPFGDIAGEVIDPFVVIRVHDVLMREGSRGASSSILRLSTSTPTDWIEITERTTGTVKDNGFCPQWDSETFSFPVVNPDVAMVEFVVMDSDKGFLDDTVCKVGIPVSCLRQGCRSVNFNDQYGQQHGPYGFATLLVDVRIEPLS